MKLVLFASSFLYSLMISAQVTQIAVVRPDGTTFICLTADSEYNKALGGDYIYLPGGNFALSMRIEKEIHFVGAGYFSDSSLATGITLTSGIVLKNGSSGGSIEGLYFNGIVQVGEGNPSDAIINNYTGEFAGKGTFGLGNDKDKIDYLLLSPALFSRMTACGLFRKGAWPGKSPKRWTVYDELENEIHVASDHHVV